MMNVVGSPNLQNSLVVAVRSAMMHECGNVSRLQNGVRVDGQPLSDTQTIAVDVFLHRVLEVVRVLHSLHHFPEDLDVCLLKHFIKCQGHGFSRCLGQLDMTFVNKSSS